MANTDTSLKEKQIEVAQSWVEIISGIRPHLKGKKVVDVEKI